MEPTSYLNILSQKDEYLENKIMDFYRGFGFVDYFIPFANALGKLEKHYIETELMVEAGTRDEGWNIFGKGI